MRERLEDMGRPISRRNILVVEGPDEAFLAMWLLEDIELPGLIDIRPPYEEVAELGEYLSEVRTSPGFDLVEAIGVLRDAEESDPTSVLESASGAFTTAFPGAPPLTKPARFEVLTFEGRDIRFGAFIAPDGESTGMLEDLCLSPEPIRKSVILSKCVKGYLDCLPEDEVDRPHWAKRRLHAYLASQPEPGLKLGEAAKAQYWHFEDPVWEPLTQFLRDLASE